MSDIRVDEQPSGSDGLPAQETGSAAARQPMTITFSVETGAWIVLGILAVISRLTNLGARVMSHDESLHVYYSWWLSKGSGYQHNPMMHGPFLFEATAFFNLLFGANDFTSRLVPALLGMCIVVGVPLLLRPWLGKAGALMAGLFFLISPYVLFYSRYNRHDIQVIAFLLLAVFAILAYLRDRREQRLFLLAAALALMLSTMEISFIYLAILAGFLILRILLRAGLAWRDWPALAEWDALAVLVTLGALFSSPIALIVLNPLWVRLTGQPFVDLAVLADYQSRWETGPAAPQLWGLLVAFWIAAAVLGYAWGRLRWLKLAGTFLAIAVPLYTTFFTNLNGFGSGFVGSLGYWLSQQGVQRGSQPLYYYLIVFPLYEYLPILLGVAALIVAALRWRELPEAERAFVALAGWWALLVWVGLSIAGEKMPWLSTHITIPFILLAGWLAGRILVKLAGVISRDTDWQNSEPRAFSWGSLAAAVPVLLLVILTIRTSYLVNYVNYDYTTEYVGYAHGAPGVKWAIEDIKRITEHLGPDATVVVANDSEVSWPMTWYLRGYSGYFGEQPNRANLENAQVIVVGPKNWKKVELYVGADYTRYEVIRMWWPNEDYKNLTWERIRSALADPQMRLALWDIFWARDYRLYGQLTDKDLNPPVTWTPEERMRIYVRKELAGQVKSLSDSQLADLQPEKSLFAGKELQVEPVQVLAQPGLNMPLGVAVAPDGSVYVLDSGNARVLKLDASGAPMATWGSRTPEGQAPAAPGTFSEPWGIAVDGQGNVYVADTWNHRIQKFDGQGNFLLQWGTGGLADDGPDRFWGPRGVAVDAQGRVYITDTGNRRVVVFDGQGSYLFQFRQAGDAQLDEPVGVAIGPDGLAYVADTWNHRVAVFNAQGDFERSWPVSGWDSISIDNKPYLAVDPQGRVILTDPEGYRVLVYSAEGEPLAAFGTFGEEAPAFDLPIGVAVDSTGQIWVADSGNQRVVVYPALAQ